MFIPDQKEQVPQQFELSLSALNKVIVITYENLKEGDIEFINKWLTRLDLTNIFEEPVTEDTVEGEVTE